MLWDFGAAVKQLFALLIFNQSNEKVRYELQVERYMHKITPWRSFNTKGSHFAISGQQRYSLIDSINLYYGLWEFWLSEGSILWQSSGALKDRFWFNLKLKILLQLKVCHLETKDDFRDKEEEKDNRITERLKQQYISFSYPTLTKYKQIFLFIICSNRLYKCRA